MLYLDRPGYFFEETTLEYPEFEIDAGEHTLILGNSGSGKTTLLHMIGGLMKPSTGDIVIDGISFKKMSESQLDRFRAQNIGIVFQKPHLIASLTVQENLHLARYLAGAKEGRAKTKELLEDLGILDLNDRKVYQISQGQAQRVSIARALINGPRLLLADEPTASLDDESCTRVINLLQEQAEKHRSTLVIATHDQRVKGSFKRGLSL